MPSLLTARALANLSNQSLTIQNELVVSHSKSHDVLVDLGRSRGEPNARAMVKTSFAQARGPIQLQT